LSLKRWTPGWPSGDGRAALRAPRQVIGSGERLGVRWVGLYGRADKLALGGRATKVRTAGNVRLTSKFIGPGNLGGAVPPQLSSTPEVKRSTSVLREFGDGRAWKDRSLFERYLHERDPVDRQVLIERFLPLAPARGPLPTRGRALRRPLPGRLRGPDQGHRPLRPRARDRVLKLRGADDPRRDQALFPRPHVVGARATCRSSP
jgi:hypothetical protein